MKKEWSLVEKLAAIAAVVLIIVGLKLASVGVGQGHLMQDDGFSVSGGFLTLFGGFTLGVLWERRKK